MAKLEEPITLRSGTVLKNRICKASMSEAMATPLGVIRQNHITLYERWRDCGAGLLITGNMMVDGAHANEPLVVDVRNPENAPWLKKWAELAHGTQVHIWPQLNHPGKQSPKIVNHAPVAPSAIPLSAELFVPPRELNDDEIRQIIEQFAESAAVCESAGFTGVQLHAAHGYLISQFLSPNHNQRTDEWGGSFENRLRFVEEVYGAIRKRTGPGFNISIKINSSDFQKGGFDADDSIRVAEALDQLGVDMLEISGGSWENPINRTGMKDSTRKREAYFLEFSEQLKARVKAPLVVTGGFRSAQAMRDAISSGAVDIVGVARPFAVNPDFGKRVLDDHSYISNVVPIKSGIKRLDQMAIMEISWYGLQLARMSEGKMPRKKPRGIFSTLGVIRSFRKKGRALQRVRAA